MLAFLQLEPETIAFWLGFLAATVFWWLAGRIRALLPRLMEFTRQRIRASRQRSLEKVDEYLRHETLRRAQTMHLSAPLFSLDEILIQPVLVAPPPQLINQGVAATDTITSQVVPYLPDWPQLSAEYPVTTITAAQALQNHVKIVLIGKPGSGKTVALATLASQIARKESGIGELAAAAPVLLHALDLVPDLEAADPLDVLAHALASKSAVVMQRQIPNFLRTTAREGKILLLLDGLDEIHPEQLKKLAAYLNALIEKYPQIDMITTGAPEYLDGLTGLGFLPLAVRCWNAVDCQQFVHRWGELWNTHITLELTRRDLEASFIDSCLLENWLLGDWGIYSPLEWTLRTWGIYAGDIRSPDTREVLESHIRRLTFNLIPFEALARLAIEYVSQGQAGLTYSHLEKVLSHFTVTPRPPARNGQPNDGKMHTRNKSNSSQRDEKKISSGGRILNLLLECGLLIEHPGEQLRLVSPVITGFLAACQEDESNISNALNPPYWSTALAAGHFLSCGSRGEDFLKGFLAAEDDPLFSRLLTAAGWLSAGPTNTEWRSVVMRKMLQVIQQETVSPLIRARMVAGFVASNDPSIPVLFKQLLSSSSAATRRLAALGCGAIRNPKLISDLTGSLADPAQEVHQAACLALAAYGGKVAGDILSQVLLHGDEHMQLVAAEALSVTPSGQEVLKEALSMDNLLVRRAAVLALAHVHEPWAMELLEKVAIEDGQWIVRSAAGQSVENLQKPDTSIPTCLPQPSEAGWLVTFAGKQGEGIIPGHVPVNLLVTALRNGETEEKLAALLYLRDYPDDVVIKAIYETCKADQDILRDAGMYTLWYLSTTGIKLPDMETAGIY